MNIQEATKKAMEIDGYITGGLVGNFNKILVIKPTNTDNLCILCADKNHRCRGWQPCASDLMSDKWETITEKDFEVLSAKCNIF